MKLAVIGATGQTGEHFVQLALKKGHEVVAMVRNPEKMKTTNDKLKVVKVDIFNADDMAPHFTDCDTVVSCLGSAYQLISEITFYSESSKAIVGAMAQAKVNRFVFITSWFVQDQPDHPTIAKWVIKPMLKKVLADMRRMENYFINECPDVVFTAVRPPQLKSDDSDGRPVVMEPDVDWSKTMERAMTRIDLAKGILKIVEENLFPRKGIVVGLPSA